MRGRYAAVTRPLQSRYIGHYIGSNTFGLHLPLRLCSAAQQHRPKASRPTQRSRALEKVNFILYYELDESEDACVLRAADYGGDAERAWVLLEAVGEAGPSGV